MEFERKGERSDDVFSKVVKAGKRTYFFDIKSTKSNDLYVTITESKKSTEDGREFFQKHKIFLYKEDFEKFRECFDETLEKIAELKKEGKYEDLSYFDKPTLEFDDL